MSLYSPLYPNVTFLSFLFPNGTFLQSLNKHIAMQYVPNMHLCRFASHDTYAEEMVNNNLPSIQSFSDLPQYINWTQIMGEGKQLPF